jgi:hypothetical protein
MSQLVHAVVYSLIGCIYTNFHPLCWFQLRTKSWTCLEAIFLRHACWVPEDPQTSGYRVKWHISSSCNTSALLEETSNLALSIVVYWCKLREFPRDAFELSPPRKLEISWYLRGHFESARIFLAFRQGNFPASSWQDCRSALGSLARETLGFHAGSLGTQEA